MLILLDGSPDKISKYSLKYGYKFGQLRTPLTNYRMADSPYAIDNGCFTSFNRVQWERLLGQSRNTLNKPLFVTVPDVVGSARRTLELFPCFMDSMCGFDKCLVMQDGIEDLEIPWSKLDAIFIGGTDKFKESDNAKACCKAAKMLNKWVHVGRVNTPGRVKAFAGLADSIDGSGISRFDHMLEAVLCEIKGMPVEQRVRIRGLSVQKAGCGPWESDDVQQTGKREDIANLFSELV
jgi:hypothetical protein